MSDDLMPGAKSIPEDREQVVDGGFDNSDDVFFKRMRQLEKRIAAVEGLLGIKFKDDVDTDEPQSPTEKVEIVKTFVRLRLNVIDVESPESAESLEATAQALVATYKRSEIEMTLVSIGKKPKARNAVIKLARQLVKSLAPKTELEQVTGKKEHEPD